jgi:hypothetical protein
VVAVVVLASPKSPRDGVIWTMILRVSAVFHFHLIELDSSGGTSVLDLCQALCQLLGRVVNSR